jgi:hypothetical protein
MIRMSLRTALLLVACTALAPGARADDLTGAGAQQRLVNAEIDAIRTGGLTPSNGCLTSLQEMHTAEQQLVDLSGTSTNAPSGSALAENEQGEVGVARDVLASDLDEAAGACRTDARQACAGPAAAKAAKSCLMVSRAVR